ncbi:MAG: hypothetical protein RLZZ175_1116 [Bacteroidota bacterium]|jgi:hypothetical protein
MNFELVFKSYFKSILLIFFCLVNFNIYSQIDVQFEDIKKEYEGHHAVYLKKREHLDLQLINDSLVITSEYYSEMLHLTEQSHQLSEKSVYHSHFMELASIDAKTLIPIKKNKFETIPVTKFETQDNFGAGVFFDDGKQTSFVYPAVRVGARTILNYKQKIKEPRFISSFFFSEHLNVLSSEFSISHPEGIKLRFQVFGIDPKLLTFSESKKGNIITVTWSANKIAVHKMEDESPNLRYYAPHIMMFVEEVTTKLGDKKKFSGDIKSLYKFFYGFVKDQVNIKEPTVDKLVDSLVSKSKTETEKAKKIFYWIQDNIKYIAFEDGFGGFIPRTPGAVLSKRYGDCKDMANLTTYMLKQAGIKAYLTWIGSRELPYTFDENPSPSAANHMICTAKIDEKWLFFDATGMYMPFGLPTDMIQGKQCLIGIDENNFEKTFVPILDKEQNTRTDSVNISIKGNAILGAGVNVLQGYPKIDLIYTQLTHDPKKQKDAIASYLQKGSNKFFLENEQILDLYNRDKVAKINYNFKIEDYAKTIDDEIYINLHLKKPFYNTQTKPERDISIEKDYKFIDDEIVVLQIPQGFKLSYLPHGQEFASKYFGYRISFEQIGNKIKMKRSVWLDALLLQKENFDSWNTMVTELSKAYREAVVLKKNN